MEEDMTPVTPDGEEKEEQYCSVCGRSSANAGPMLKLPNGLNICQDCMQKLQEARNDL